MCRFGTPTHVGRHQHVLFHRHSCIITTCIPSKNTSKMSTVYFGHSPIFCSSLHNPAISLPTWQLFYSCSHADDVLSYHWQLHSQMVERRHNSLWQCLLWRDKSVFVHFSCWSTVLHEIVFSLWVFRKCYIMPYYVTTTAYDIVYVTKIVCWDYHWSFEIIALQTYNSNVNY